MYLFIVIFSLYLLYIYTYNSTNHKRHKDADSLYAHFSMIDKYNYLLYPKLLFASPTYITLKAGESLYIPRKWWHWVKTSEKTFAINYWFNNTNNMNPFKFNYDMNIDINILNNVNVSIWDSKTNELAYNTTFNKFYNSGEDYKYLITLLNFDIGYSNIKIKEVMKPYIKFPDNININTNNFGYNIWVSSGKHDTGLHYDDEDGILTVIEGTKDIILFPPSDIKYLYPYKVSYEWYSNIAYDFRYNSYTNNGIIKSKSSSQLLYETAKDNVKVLANISKLYKKHKQLVWGFKKNNDIYRWEFYKYTLDKNPAITSWDIMNDSYNIGDTEHYYYNNNNIVKLPFWGHGKYKQNDIIYDESKIFVIDSYESFLYNYDNYMTKLGYNDIKDDFKDIILNKYICYEICYEICIHNKKHNQIFVQYLGISNKDFIIFLTENNYPKNIIDFVDSDYIINNEITIVYDIKSKEIVRSGFYGIIT